MQFLHPYLLLALVGVAIPVIIHLFNRRHAREIPWGAMRFLMTSLIARRRRLLLEEILLLVLRVLLVASAVLLFARPFIQQGHGAGWLVVPLGFFGLSAFGASFALSTYRRWQVGMWLVTLLGLGLAASASWWQARSGRLSFARDQPRDIALVLDGSTSMTLEHEGTTNFERARAEVLKLIQTMPRDVAFSLIVAGASAELLVPAPISDRKHLLQALAAAAPVHGCMQAPDALASAVATLAQGSHLTQQIILWGDGQAAGWQCDDLTNWHHLQAAMAKLVAPPPLFIRNLSLPPNVRNLTLQALDFARPLAALDREFAIEVLVANTGREAVTPTRVELLVEGQQQISRALGQLAPGEAQTVNFRHRFRHSGAQVVTAQIVVEDDLPLDNQMQRVVQVLPQLRVLIVDEGRRGAALQRAGGFLSLALQPFAPGATTNATHFLMAPELIAREHLALKHNLHEYAMVVLADVAQLTPADATRLTAYTRAGGHLLLAHGARAAPDFFNAWHDDATPFLPLHLGALHTAQRERLDPARLTHAGLARLQRSGDLSGLVVECYRTATPRGGDDSAPPGVYLKNGDPLLAQKTVAHGSVTQVAMPLDQTAGNLVTQPLFLPLVHELVLTPIEPLIPTLNRPAAPRALLPLAAALFTAPQASGLLAEYRDQKTPTPPLLTRVDPTLDFNWQGRAPAPELPRDHFTVHWQGTLTPPQSGTYTFFMRADDHLTLELAGKRVQTTTTGHEQQVELALEGGVSYPLKADFREESGEAYLRVEVAGPELPRQTLPRAWLRPVMYEREPWSQALATTVHTPRRGTVAAQLRNHLGTVELRFEQPLMPGLYEVALPPLAQFWLRNLVPGATNLPFCVVESAAESQLEPLSEEEKQIIAQQLVMRETSSLDDLLKALRGETFGRELWQWPAVFLWILLLLEPWLTRWIFHQRHKEV